MSTQKQNWRESLINILCNVVFPLLIMTKLNKAEYLWPIWALVIALLLPLCYGLIEWVRTKKTNIFSVVWMVSIMLTGWIGLLQIPPAWVAIKEAWIPLLLGIGVFVAIWMWYPVAKVFVLHALDMELINTTLKDSPAKLTELEKLEQWVSYVFGGSFFISAILNYLLAIRIVTAQPWTEEFTAQIGRMTWLSFPVIALPMMIILMVAVGYLLWRVGKLTGLGIEDLVKS
jgi:hypothetical protein